MIWSSWAVSRSIAGGVAGAAAGVSGVLLSAQSELRSQQEADSKDADLIRQLTGKQ